MTWRKSRREPSGRAPTSRLPEVMIWDHKEAFIENLSKFEPPAEDGNRL